MVIALKLTVGGLQRLYFRTFVTFDIFSLAQNAEKFKKVNFRLAKANEEMKMNEKRNEEYTIELRSYVLYSIVYS